MPAISMYLRLLRGATDLSQEEAARRADISAKTLGRWERADNEHEPGISNLKRLVQVLGGSTKDALQLLVRDDLNEDDGRETAEKWLALSLEERQRIDSVLASTSPDELAQIIDELREESHDDPSLVTLLRGVLLGLRARGSGSPRR
jgi:transcriptional regulator with XRE-family HTH domain